MNFSLEAFKSKLLEAQPLKIHLKTIERLYQFYELLIQWNKIHNLTGPLSFESIVYRHCIECLALSELIDTEFVYDLGSGAGLPGIPLAMYLPNKKFFLVESRQKRVQFMRTALLNLNIDNVEIFHGRIEELKQSENHISFLARALAKPQEVIRLVSDIFKTGDQLIIPCQKKLDIETLEINKSCYKVVVREFSKESKLNTAALLISRQQ